MQRIVSILLLGLLVQSIGLLTADEPLQAGAAMRIIAPKPLLPVSGGMGRSTLAAPISL